jgi:putative phosphoribosyl transferase
MDERQRQRFRDRGEAGQLLAKQLGIYKGRSDVIVLALPRGGVPVAFEIARELKAPLDVLVVRKLGVPWHPELAMGAIAGDGFEVLNGEVVTGYNISPHVIRAVADREAQEMKRRVQRYRGDRPFPSLTGLTVVVVDDGLATGSTMRVAAKAIRHESPRVIVVAVPVAAASTCRELRCEVDDVICLRTPPDFSAVGCWYEDFSQTSDEEVRRLLSKSAAALPAVH